MSSRASHSVDVCWLRSAGDPTRKEKKRKEKKRKEKKRKDYAFRRQLDEKPSIIPGGDPTMR